MIVRVCLLPARLGKAHFQSRRALSCRTWRRACPACTTRAVGERCFVPGCLYRSPGYVYSDEYERMLRKWV